MERRRPHVAISPAMCRSSNRLDEALQLRSESEIEAITGKDGRMLEGSEQEGTQHPYIYGPAGRLENVRQVPGIGTQTTVREHSSVELCEPHVAIHNPCHVTVL